MYAPGRPNFPRRSNWAEGAQLAAIRRCIAAIRAYTGTNLGIQAGIYEVVYPKGKAKILVVEKPWKRGWTQTLRNVQRLKREETTRAT